ncbi:FecR family protein [Pedobacter hartonius]|uniref:FecR family protein n=1 Tax=Pedobacter hartonius TaxID=425514 RepID=A0A1H3XU59_9SPHI|nr:FecR family protein [Pedobacter hartonius]SEA02144.1 FecR family protein [Pedobacter hartonius]
MGQDIPTQFFEKIKKQASTEQDHQQFNEWLHTASESELEKILDQYGWYFQNQTDELHPDSDRMTAAIINRISGSEGVAEAGETKHKRIFLWSAFGKAAALAMMISSIVLFYYFKKKDVHQTTYTTVNMPVRKIVPGGNKAVLILADGSSIMLDSAKNGMLTTQNNVHVYKLKNGQLFYNATASKSNHKMAFNTIITPRGGQYQVILPDGSKVWLNSESELRYPSAFAGNQRAVELIGEAYFEVAKDKKRPFKISINHMQVEVLGTHFNIMGYKDEAATKTTLLEGSVRIIKGLSQKLIVPGEQATVAEHIDVASVNTEEAIEWKKGNFNFSHEKLGSIMRKVARWYDIEVDYEGKTTNATFVGTIPQSKNIEEVLKYLELTGLVHFKINERRITVMP